MNDSAPEPAFSLREIAAANARLTLLGLAMIVTAFVANAALFTATYRVVHSALGGALVGLLAGAALFVFPWMRRIHRLQAGLVILLVIGGWWAFASLLQTSLRRPHLVQLDQGYCKAFEEAGVRAGKPDAFPCTFKAHLFPDGKGGFYAYGVSENIKHKCRWIGAGVIDIGSVDTDVSMPPLDALPAHCEQELTVPFADRRPQTW